MMKNVILISQDRVDITEEQRKRIVTTILSDGYFNIVLMIVNSSANKETYINLGVKQVMDSMEIEYAESMEGLNYQDIADFKDLQLEIENGAYRMFGDYQMGKYYYYSSICFWERFFRNHDIDIVLHTKDYHGFCYDCVDIVARKYGIKSFHIRQAAYNCTYHIYHSHKIIPVYMHQAPNIEYLLSSYYEKDGIRPSFENKNFLRKLFYMIGGNLLEDFVIRFVKWDWNARSWLRKRKKISWSDKFFGYMRLCSIKRYMKSLAKRPLFDSKYICYFLHTEPEAAIQVTTILESQLVIIKILSETVPLGWKVYVKEHPVQFDANNDSGYYHMIDYPLFKTKEFYKKINAMPNVEIIDNKIKSSVILKNAQAIASIAGTVLFEGVLEKKPIITFSELNPIAFLKEVFNIRSFDDCERAMGIIENGFYPKYKDADEVIRKYVFKGEFMPENILALLHQECKQDRVV